MPAPERNNAIDLLRVLCIVYIVGYWHLIPYTSWLPGYANQYTEALKDIALGTFVFSSGLLLARRDVQLRFGDILTFYQRRIVRIYPLYLLALILFGLAGLASWPVIAKAAVLISSFAPPPPPTLWFITMIMFFYLLAPFLIWAARSALGFVVWSAVLLLACLVYNTYLKPMDSRLFLLFPSFALGIYAQRARAAKAFIQRHHLWLLALLIPAFWLGLPGNNGFDISTSLLRAPLVALGAVLLVIYTERLCTQLHSPFILALSYASFGVYLFHRLIFIQAITLYYPTDGFQQVLYLLALAVPVTFVLAYVVQKLYDTGLARLVSE